MIAWLTSDYQLDPREAHVLVGMAAKLTVGSWFGTSVCELPKKYLPPRAPASSKAQP